MTFILGWSIQDAARTAGYSERTVRAWIRDFGQSGRKCAVFNCWQPSQKHQCEIHLQRGRYDLNKPTRLIQTRAWKLARRWFITSHPVCGMRLDGRRHSQHSACDGRRAFCVDHIDRHAGDGWDFWDIDNWQALCPQCHGRKSRDERKILESPWL
jgi:hypothetical protein